MLKNMLKNTDWLVLIIPLILCVIGILGIYSAGYTSSVNSDEYTKQLIWFAISMVFVIVIWFVPPRYFEVIGYIIYVLGIILLVAVLFTNKIMGASSWFNLYNKIFIQPSEFMKIGYIMCLASILNKYHKSNMSKKELYKKWISIGITFLLPVILIVAQPDFGTAITFVFITLFMIFVSGVKYRYIFLVILIFLVSLPIVYKFVLNDTQKMRIQVFLNPSLDPLGSGYNAIQSKIAVGSGMLFGSGYLNGTQTQYGYLPIKSSDFIFSVLSEELGFLASAGIIILFTLLITRILKDSSTNNDNYNKYLMSGIAGMLSYHFIQNVGMTFGVLPITGVPLPFVSYGGSSLITNFILIGLILNITSRKERNFLF